MAVSPAGPARSPRIGRLLLAAGLAHLTLAVSASVLPEWGDLAIFRHWAERVSASGIATAYSTHPHPDLRFDWPPLYLYVSHAVGVVHRTLGVSDAQHAAALLALLLKLPMIAFNLATAGLLLRWASALGLEPSVRRWVVVAWLANPSIALATDVFGYQDALHTALLVGAAVRLGAGGAGALPLLTLAALTKPQAWIFLLPFGVVLVRRAGTRLLAREIGLALIVALAVLAPFLAAGEGGPLLRAHLDMPSLHAVPSALAHNLWWILFPAADETSFSSDRAPIIWGLTPRHLGLALLAGYALAVARRLARRPTSEALAGLSALLGFAFFMLVTQIHENHLYAMFPFLTLAAATSRFLRGVLLTLTLSFAANLYLGLRWLEGGAAQAAGTLAPSLINSMINMAMLLLWTRRTLVPRAEP